MDLALVMSIAVVVLIVVIIGGVLLGLFAITSGYAKHNEELRQADLLQDELRAENPEYNYSVDEFSDGTIEFTHDVIDATAIFDPNKKLLRLESADRDDCTEDCRSQEDAEMAFEDYLRGIYEPNPVEPPDFSKPYPTPKRGP